MPKEFWRNQDINHADKSVLKLKYHGKIEITIFKY